MLFDTEWGGLPLQPVLSSGRPVADFQDWMPWRRVVVAALAAIAEELDADLVVPQTVIGEAYWTEIQQGLRQHGVPVLAFTLDVSAEEHERRIADDREEAGAANWRRRRRHDYDLARPWL